MNTNPRLVRSPRTWLLGGVLLLALASVAYLVIDRADGAGANEDGVPARQWPAFSMTYTEYEVDPATGAVLTDRTWDLEVEDDYTWRADLIRDALEPAEVGSYRELRDGKYSNFSAMLQHTNSRDADATVSITMELSPAFYAWVRDGMYRGAGFQQMESGPGAYVATRSADGVNERIEFTTDHIGDEYYGGVTVAYERSVDGEVVRRFTADSLSMR